MFAVAVELAAGAPYSVATLQTSIWHLVTNSGSCTGLSEKIPAKFGDTCSVRAYGLCIGYIGQRAERGRENSNMQEFFRTTL